MFCPIRRGKPLAGRHDHQLDRDRDSKQDQRREEPQRQHAGLGFGPRQAEEQQQRRQGERECVEELEIEAQGLDRLIEIRPRPDKVRID